MKCLLDTHALLWVLFDPSQLSRAAAAAIIDQNNDIFVSPVNLWELSLKYSLGKLELEGISPGELPDTIEESGMVILPLSAADAATSHLLPRLGHKDPFDRLLVWQAIRNDLVLISKNGVLRAAYEDRGLSILW
jgi:PIN domain nuclease of toxin-antitoxin system